MISTSRRGFLSGTAAAALATALPGIAFAATEEPRFGGTLSFITSDPPVLVSLTNTGAATYVSGKVTEGLFNYDFDLNPIPLLATDWSLSDDGLIYTFHLRQGVRWHDGEPFTAEDVVFSIDAARRYNPRGISTFANVVEVRAIDEHTAEVVLSQPAPFLISALAPHETPILPAHRYEGQQIDTAPNNNAPIGTGPFKFVEWERGSHIIFERNPDYWDAPKPYLDRVVVRIIADASARTIALETGEVHASQGSVLALNDLEALLRNPAFASTTRGNEYDNSITHLIFNLDRPHLHDVRVRRAIAHAIDRQFVLDNAWYGYGQLFEGTLSPLLTRFYHGGLEPYAFDPERAEALLDEAGYPRGADGIRFCIHHDPMPGTEAFRVSAEYFKQALERVGIEVTIRSQDFATYTRRVYTDRDFDFTYGYMSTTFDPTVGVQRLFWSQNFRPGVPFTNGANYANPEVDALLEAASVEIDPEARVQQWRRIQEIVHEELPDLGILISSIPTIYDARLRNLVTGADGLRSSFADVWFAE